MTIRSTIDGGRKAPKVAKLELNRETLQELTDGEAGALAGGRKPLPPPVTHTCPPPYTCTPACETRKSLVFFCNTRRCIGS